MNGTDVAASTGSMKLPKLFDQTWNQRRNDYGKLIKARGLIVIDRTLSGKIGEGDKTETWL